MVFLHEYLSADRILFLDDPQNGASDKSSALELMIQSVKDAPFMKDYPRFRQAVFDREDIMSTGIGYQVAIPHVKNSAVDSFFISVGIHREGIEWDALDGKPVNLVFLIGGVEDHQLYLRILAKLTLVIKNKRLRQDIVNATTADEVLAMFGQL